MEPQLKNDKECEINNHFTLRKPFERVIVDTSNGSIAIILAQLDGNAVVRIVKKNQDRNNITLVGKESNLDGSDIKVFPEDIREIEMKFRNDVWTVNKTVYS